MRSKLELVGAFRVLPLVQLVHYVNVYWYHELHCISWLLRILAIDRQAYSQPRPQIRLPTRHMISFQDGNQRQSIRRSVKPNEPIASSNDESKF